MDVHFIPRGEYSFKQVNIQPSPACLKGRGSAFQRPSVHTHLCGRSKHLRQAMFRPTWTADPWRGTPQHAARFGRGNARLVVPRALNPWQYPGVQPRRAQRGPNVPERRGTQRKGRPLCPSCCGRLRRSGRARRGLDAPSEILPNSAYALAKSGSLPFRYFRRRTSISISFPVSDSRNFQNVQPLV